MFEGFIEQYAAYFEVNSFLCFFISQNVM